MVCVKKTDKKGRGFSVSGKEVDRGMCLSLK